MKTTGNFQIKIKLSARGDRKKSNKATDSYGDREETPDPEKLSGQNEILLPAIDPYSTKVFEAKVSEAASDKEVVAIVSFDENINSSYKGWQVENSNFDESIKEQKS